MADTYDVVVDCGHSDYTSEIVEIQNNIDILTETVKGTNSIILLIFVLMVIGCIYRLLRFIF